MGGGGWGTPQRAEVKEAGRALPPEPGRRSQRAGETDSDLSAATGQLRSGAAWEPPSATGAARGDSARAPDPGDPRPSRSASEMRAELVSAADGGGWPRPGRRNQGPTRAWSVLPDNFLQLPSETTYGVSETNLALPELALSCHPLLPVVPDESSESWPGNPPPTVFRSIRCQLSLQDLDDFVDQESHGSEESSSGHKESPGTPEEGLQPVLETSSWGELRDPNEGLSVSSNEGSPSRIRQSLRYRGNAPSFRKVPTGAKSFGDHSQEASPWPASRFRRSLRRSARTGRTYSSSDEEHLDEDLLKRSRRPPRSRKPSKAGALPSPRVDIVLVQKFSDANVVARQPHNSWVPSRDTSAALIHHRPPEHKSSLVPLDAREHEWIVRLASGSWLDVQTLFWEDPQLALHRDFLTGYTALHWIAKHGDLHALQDFISGAQEAGIVLDVNVRSSCGYTPLHLAAIHGHQGVIKLLVERLASRVNVRDYSGKKPWQYLTSNVTGETWQLLGAPRGKPIFPVYPLVQSSSPTRKVKSREMSRNVTRKTSLAALLKTQHNKWKMASQYEKFHTPKEREEYSD
ncbi:ankyrin repeat domain-containing protein SOWAHB isoform X1 [Cricetulus griseus]|uniref:ankyrin repeat domain-containing protein SOWAHB isoform X1 n=1 Tax=Cricetulus griseus TaxID=10029 RepID=UPI00022F7079|nr:ankyrin repeat domain-containing protein SOWAHB isoform X1 [Cricetulus griseus]